jgi:hypothetical protein
MGVRLYPNTQDPAALETLAGVPAGTHARLSAVEAEFAPRLNAAPDFFARNAIYDEKYNRVNDDDAMGDLDNFLTFGWGRFQHVAGLSDGCVGRLDAPADAQRLLDHNGIEVNAALAGGVHWC